MTPSDHLDAAFAALANPTRRAILARLTSGEASVAELAEPFEMSQPAISKHLDVLERAGLVSVEPDGRRRPRRLEGDGMRAPLEWLSDQYTVWERNYRRLDTLLEALQAPNADRPRRRTKK